MRKGVLDKAKSLAIAAAIIAILPAAGAAAQEIRGKQAGDFNVRLRGIAVVPDNASRPVNNATTGARASTLERADTSASPEIDLSYFITSNFALELIAATTQHKLTVGAPSFNNGTKLADVGVLPPTLTLQYHPLPKSTFSPYIGAGVNYTFFYNTNADSANFNGLKLKNSWGWALQAGLDVMSSGPWSLNLDVKKIFLKTEATVNLNPATGLRVDDVKLDPWVVGGGIGYRF
jgi:outer membrane protein